MKRLFFVITAILVSFVGLKYMQNTTQLALNVVPQERYEEIQKQQNKKPKLPAKQFKASALEYNAHLEEQESFGDVEKLIEQIDATIENPIINAADIDRGWYVAHEGDKKLGTPSQWIWMEIDGGGRYVSPDVLDDLGHDANQGICESSGGQYHRSCLDTEVSCEYIPETVCTCPEGTVWDEEGCIVLDKEGQMKAVTPEELLRGWYPGYKRKGTPSHWIYNPQARPTRWQNPIN